MKEHILSLRRNCVALAGCIFAGAVNAVAESAFSIDVIRDSNNDAFVEFTTRPWFSYELEKSSDLLTWEPSGVTAYGFGQTVRTFVYDDVSNSGGQPSPPTSPAPGYHFSLRAFNDGTALVSWQSESGVLCRVLDTIDLSGGPGALISTEITDSGDPYFILAVISPVTPPTQDYSAFTPTALPQGEFYTWTKYFGARDEILTRITSPPAQTPGENAGNQAVGGAADFYRAVESRSDLDGDGLWDDEEDVLGTDAYDEDSDGDGVTDGDEVALGSNPKDANDIPDPQTPEAKAAFDAEYQRANIAITGDASKLTYTGTGVGELGQLVSRVFPAITGPTGSSTSVLRVFRRGWRYAFGLTLTATGPGKSASFTLSPIDADGASSPWMSWVQVGPDSPTTSEGSQPSGSTLEPLELSIDANRDGVIDWKDEKVTDGVPLEFESAYEPDGTLRETGALVICHYDEDEQRTDSVRSGPAQPVTDILHQANSGILSHEDFLIGPGEKETVTFMVDGEPEERDIIRDIHPVHITIPDNLPANAKLYLVAPDMPGVPSNFAHRAFHIYRHIEIGETAVWGGFHGTATPAPWTQGSHPDTNSGNNQRELTWLLNKNAEGYEETRPSEDGPYVFGVEGLLYRAMKYRYEGEGEPADELHDFGGDIELRLDLEDANGRRTVDTIRWSQIRVPAFPGAEGAGKWALGGRYGEVYKVTTLADSGAGSLRHGIENRETIPNSNPPRMRPRTIVFDVAGYIDLESPLLISEDFLTIAGQTAPGAGICLRNFGIENTASHVVVRYLRSRPGDELALADDPGTDWRDDMIKDLDAFTIWAGNHIIIDHCSATWGTDTALDIAVRTDLIYDRRITVQWCLIGQTLRWSFHPEDNDHLQDSHPSGIPQSLQLEDHSMGSAIIGFNGAAYSFHHNLYANCRHQTSRMPKLRNSRPPTVAAKDNQWVFDFRNNVVYNWAPKPVGANSFAGNLETKDIDGHTSYNFVNNYFKVADGHLPAGLYVFLNEHLRATPYFNGNELWYYSNGKLTKDNRSQVGLQVQIGSGKSPVSEETFVLEPLTQTQISTESRDAIINRVGVSIFKDPVSGNDRTIRDATDSAIISDLNEGRDGTLDSHVDPPAIDPYSQPPASIERWTINRNWIPDFERKGGIGYAQLLPESVGEDTDQDALLDEWEISRFSDLFPTNTLEQVRPEDDYDNDGQTVLDDYLNDSSYQEQ